MRAPLGVIAVLVVGLALASAFEAGSFKKCDDIAFCRLHRNLEPQAEGYHVVPDTVRVDGAVLTATLVNREQLELSMTLTGMKDNTMRLVIDEVDGARPRHAVPDVLVFDEAASEAPLLFVERTPRLVLLALGDAAKESASEGVRITLVFDPFEISVTTGGVPTLSVGKRGLLKVEPYAAAPDAAAVEAFAQKWDKFTDPQRFGPASVGMDVTFLASDHVYGVPERGQRLSLPVTRGEGADEGTEPYRMYNLDVFKYELNHNMGLYGAVPLLLSTNGASTAAVLWLNSAETYVDVENNAHATSGKHTHWYSETGRVDMFLMLGPAPRDVFRQYTALTGTPFLPPQFAIGYHQCRWNYKSEEDVAQVDAGFDSHDMPYDVLWLDIEHTDGKRYFTWDKVLFPTPEDMQARIAAKGRKMVTIIDPHIKADPNYHVYAEAKRRGFFVKDKDGGDFEGNCWPGKSSYLDLMDPEVRAWWASLFAKEQYKGATDALYTWIDMNEPSVFSGPEITMPKSNLHLGGAVEHREVHNMYGFYQSMAAVEGHRHLRGADERPFVLTRSFFPGSQRYAAVWTGDNMAQWDHLEFAQPMLLTLQLSGITFSGADVGGFFDNPEPELLVRWYQAAAFHPFFRGHAELQTARREPWLFGEPHTSNIRAALRRRYQILPYLYTLFREASVSGMPIMRPLWVEFPTETQTFAMDDEFLLGADLLIKPVVKGGVTSTHVFLPGWEWWYEWETGEASRAPSTLLAQAPPTRIPVFQRGGSIVPTRNRARRSSAAMAHDPFTLNVALDSHGRAAGKLYLDDGHSMAYTRGEWAERTFTWEDNHLRTGGTAGSVGYTDANTIERIRVLGVDTAPARVVLQLRDSHGVVDLTFTHNATTRVLTLRKPGVGITADFTITLKK